MESDKFILQLKPRPSYSTEGLEMQGASGESLGFSCPLSGRFQQFGDKVTALIFKQSV